MGIFPLLNCIFYTFLNLFNKHVLVFKMGKINFKVLANMSLHYTLR